MYIITYETFGKIGSISARQESHDKDHALTQFSVLTKEGTKCSLTYEPEIYNDARREEDIRRLNECKRRLKCIL